MCLDIKQIRDTEFHKFIDPRLESRLELIKERYSIDMLAEWDGLYVISLNTVDEGKSLIYYVIKGKNVKDRVLKSIHSKSGKQIAEEKLNGINIYKLFVEDDLSLHYFFQKPDIMYISDTRDNVLKAYSTYNEKKMRVQKGSELLKLINGVDKDAMVWGIYRVSDDDRSGPFILLRDVESLTLSCSYNGSRMLLKLNLFTDSEAGIHRTAKTLNSLKSMSTQRFSDKPELLDLINAIAIKQAGRSVEVEWTIPEDTIKLLTSPPGEESIQE